MSISRLVDPSTRPHEVSDDLESFFWVLLYQVVKCRNSKRNLEQEIQDVFDQRIKMDQNGDFRGGTGKRMCLYRVLLDKKIVRHLVKTPCRRIIEELRALFFNFHLFNKEGPSLSDSDSSSTDEDEWYDLRVQKTTQVRESNNRLKSSKWILEMINRHLSSEWDEDDDGSLHKTSLRLRIEMRT